MALVLVVDDDMSFRFFLKALFETEGHRVMTARDAVEGLARMAGATPDLITLDVMMPGHGGLEFYRALHQSDHWRGVPVIMLSGVKAAAYSHALAMNGLCGEQLPEPCAYLEKPPRPERLLELARGLLTSHDSTATQEREDNGI